MAEAYRDHFVLSVRRMSKTFQDNCLDFFGCQVKARHTGKRRHPGSFSSSSSKPAWIPASAGTRGTRVDFQSTNSEPLGLEPRVVQRLPQATQLDCSISGGLLAVNHPRNPELIDKHSETHGPESLLDRHFHCSVFCQCVKYAFRVCRVVDADRHRESF
jgi:hypothetical protein